MDCFAFASNDSALPLKRYNEASGRLALQLSRGRIVRYRRQRTEARVADMAAHGGLGIVRIVGLQCRQDRLVLVERGTGAAGPGARPHAMDAELVVDLVEEKLL